MKTETRKIIETLKSNVRTEYALEVLEYENKNHLAGDNKSRSEERQVLSQCNLELIDRLTKSL